MATPFSMTLDRVKSANLCCAATCAPTRSALQAIPNWARVAYLQAVQARVNLKVIAMIWSI